MADDIVIIKIPKLTLIQKDIVGQNSDLVVETASGTFRTKSSTFLIDIINDLVTTNDDAALSSTMGVTIKGLIDWGNEIDGLIFDYDANWTLVNTALDIAVTIPIGKLRETDNSAVVTLGATSGTVAENGGIVLTKVSPSAYSYTFVGDLTTVEDGAEGVYIIAKNLNGTLYTRNASLASAIPSTGQVSSPNSSTDGKVTLYEGTTGKILKESRIGESEITRSNRAIMRGFANGVFHEFEYEIIEDSGTVYAEVWPTLELWLVGTSYTKYNAIHYDGYKYTAIKDSTGEQPDEDFTTDPANTTATWYQDEEWDGDLHGTLDGTDRVYTLDTTTGSGVDGHARVALTAGTSEEPQLNLVYCSPVGDTRVMALTSSLTLPLGGVVFIGYAGIWDAPSHSGGRAAFPQQRFTNAFYKDSIEKSLIGAIREVIRRRGITHADGTIGSCVITTNAGLDGLDVENTSGLVYQLWPHLFPENASALNLYQFNSYDVGGNKLAILTDLNEIIEAADGTSLRANNARYALEIFGIINSGTGVIDALAVNVSSSTYSSDALCISDAENKSVTTVPDNYYLTAFRICRIPFKYSTGGGGTIINLLGTTEVQDRRKWALGGSGGGAGGGGVIDHDDLNNIMAAGTGEAHGHIDDQAQSIAGAKSFDDNLTFSGTTTHEDTVFYQGTSGDTTGAKSLVLTAAGEVATDVTAYIALTAGAAVAHDLNTGLNKTLEVAVDSTITFTNMADKLGREIDIVANVTVISGILFAGSGVTFRKIGNYTALPVGIYHVCCKVISATIIDININIEPYA